MGSPASDGPSGGAQLQLSRKATGGRALVIGPRQCPLEHGLGDWSGRPTTWSGYGLPPDHQFTRRTSQPINDPHFTLTVTTFRARTCSLAELEDQTGHPDAAADTLEWVIDLDRYAEDALPSGSWPSTPPTGRHRRGHCYAGNLVSASTPFGRSSGREVRRLAADPTSTAGARRPQTVPAGTRTVDRMRRCSRTPPVMQVAAQQTVLTGHDVPARAEREVKPRCTGRVAPVARLDLSARVCRPN